MMLGDNARKPDNAQNTAVSECMRKLEEIKEYTTRHVVDGVEQYCSIIPGGQPSEQEIKRRKDMQVFLYFID